MTLENPREKIPGKGPNRDLIEELRSDFSFDFEFEDFIDCLSEQSENSFAAFLSRYYFGESFVVANEKKIVSVSFLSQFFFSY